jgi:hypothetical protein
MVKGKWHKWRQSSLIGMRVGRLKVISLESSGSSKGRLWLCQCDCGNTIVVPTGRLTNSNTSSCGCLSQELNHPDLVGQRFGMLTVVEAVGIRKSRSIWKCLCDCGHEKEVQISKLRGGGVRSCGCLRNTPGGYHLGLGESTRNTVIRSYQDNALHHNLVWEISKEQTIKLLAGNCYYCGCPPSRVRKNPHKYGSFTYNGIDRLDNSKGYIEGNVVSCCTLCNYKKHQMSFQEFFNWVTRVADHLRSQIAPM